MTTRIIASTICDKHGADEAVPGEPVAVSRDGLTYTQDLCPEHRAEFDKMFDGLVVGASTAPPVRRKVRAGKARPVAARRSSGPGAKVREWAAGNGYEVRSRGRLPAEVRAAYAAAH